MSIANQTNPMENNTSSGGKRPARMGTSDTIVAYLLAGLIVVWLLAYTYFAARAWIGRP